MARAAVIIHVPIPAAHVHRIQGERAPDDAAQLYERELPDHFDLMLLGVGEDAHIASLFPASPLLRERRRRAAAVWVPHLKNYRITLTPPAILSANGIVVLAAGTSKAAPVSAAFQQPSDVQRYPVHVLREATDRVEWIIDRAAARDVSERHA
jgi:6-phosphogluconolactonase